MATATAPPLIAPGIICPKCKGPMLDERKAKRTDKSPDYTCANMTCVETKNGKSYRTAIWAEKSSNGSAGGEMGKPTAGTPSAAPSADSSPPEKPRLDRIYIRATNLILDEVVPLYTKAGIGCSDGAVAAMVATLFIAASKVEGH